MHEHKNDSKDPENLARLAAATANSEEAMGPSSFQVARRLASTNQANEANVPMFYQFL